MQSATSGLPLSVFDLRHRRLRKRDMKKETRARVSLFLEAPPGFEPGVKDLQSHALPLGYGAKKMERATRFELATSTLARWRSAK